MAASFALAAGAVLATGLLGPFACAMDASAQSEPQTLAPNQTAPPISLPADLPVLPTARQARLDPLLLEIDIPHLQALYAARRTTVTEVTRWYLGRIARYNGIYRSVQTVDAKGALATARREDEQHGGAHGPLWGVPIVVKANTAVQGLPDTDGWAGFALPGHEFIAPRDATIVARLRAAGAVILGITNMPDFAASDTNRSTAFGRTGNAYDVRFSPGGSSGGTATTVTSNEAMLGTGSDTANSIRMPAGTSSLVGVLPTRGLTSIAGIAPLDWLRDNTGPIARNVTDAAIALDVMAGEDPLDFRTAGAAMKAQPGPYTRYLEKGALRGERFGVPAFFFTDSYAVMRPETRAMLMQAIAQLRGAGAQVVLDDQLLPQGFMDQNRKINTTPYRKDGADQWLAAFGPPEYHTGEQYSAATGVAMPAALTGALVSTGALTAATAPTPQLRLHDDPRAESNYFGPQRTSLTQYLDALNEFHLDGLVYPSAQMPPPDETMAQDGQLSSGPHSMTGFINRIGVPAAVVPAGFYPDGLPFGLEFAGRPWRDGDLLGWAYAFEQATRARRLPTLIENGLLPISR
jgi:amidase